MMDKNEEKIVAIIGRPNVGKSTLFNRLVGRRIAIESEVSGTTRDRLFGTVSWAGRQFTLVDVAGLETGSKKEIDQKMQLGVNIAIESADLIIFAVDWHEPENQVDRKVARILRNSSKKVLLAVNKVDNVRRFDDVDVFKRLGFSDPWPVSAISGLGTGDLLDEVIKNLDFQTNDPKYIRADADCDLKLAIIGRPNVGKSTLLNTIIGEKRAVVSSEAGTTRDIVSVSFHHKGKKILIQDTAGLRRPGKITKETIESFSVIRTEQALKNSDIAVLVIDAVEGLVALDANILGEAKEWGKGIVLAVNKIDEIKEDKDEYIAKTIWQLQSKLNFAPWLPVVFISAQNEENINSLLNQVVAAFESRNTVIDEKTLNEITEHLRNKNSQLAGLTRMTQKSVNPPTFELKFKGNRVPHKTQIRYIENIIRDVFPMSGTPIFLDLAIKKDERTKIRK